MLSIVLEITKPSTINNFNTTSERNDAAIKIQSLWRAARARAVARELRENRVIADGYGEYVVFRDAPNKFLYEDEYECVYELLNAASHDPDLQIENRSELLSSQLQKIDPSFKIAFIPRTLYELIYIQASIKEDLTSGDACRLKYLNSYNHFIQVYRKPASERNKEEKKLLKHKLSKCWHLVRFDDFTPSANDLHPLVKVLAFRANNLIVSLLNPAGSFKKWQIHEFTTTLLNFYTQFRQTSHNQFRHSIETDIASERGQKTIYNAIDLECSNKAKNAFLLYRGGFNFQKPFHVEDVNNTSFCYGTSLFAGSQNDLNATAFHYMIAFNRPGYVVIVPYRKAHKAPYYIPKTNTISQIISSGEYFHGRSLIPRDCKKDKVFGLVNRLITPQLRSRQNALKLTENLNYYEERAYLLTQEKILLDLISYIFSIIALKKSRNFLMNNKSIFSGLL